MFSDLLADVRFALRMMRKNLGFSAIAIATLALGVGANTAIFSVVDAVILRPLAYPDSNRLVVMHEIIPKFVNLAPLLPVNAMHFLEWRKSAHSFESMALIGGTTWNLTGSGGEPQRLDGARVSPSLFRMLGVQPVVGRLFTDEEDAPGRDLEALITNDLWRNQFASDPNIVKRKITLDGTPFQVVGVLPASFEFPKLSQLFAMTITGERPRIWRPFGLRDSEKDELGDFNYICIGKLKNGVSMATALAELNSIQNYISTKTTEKVELHAAVVPMQAQITGRSRNGLQLILGAVGAVLLIGCVNIANLLLARATRRRQEIAIRSAIGAATSRLVRQMLVESLVLAVIGGALGVALAVELLHAILAYAPVDLPRLNEVHLDVRILLFALSISIAAGLLFGFLPAWRFSQTDPQDALKVRGSGAAGGRGGGRLRAILVSIEVGMSAVCLIAAGLLLHSFINLLNVERGFETSKLVTVDLSLPYTRYPDVEKKAAFMRLLLDRLKALPGVISASVVNKLPLTGEGDNNIVAVEGSNLPLIERPLADMRQVNPDYFRTMSIPLRRGRAFTDSDRSHKVGVVSASMAERLWPGQDPVGKRFQQGGDQNEPPVEVLGVAGDIRGASLTSKPGMTVYMPYWQRFSSDLSLAVKTGVDPRSLSSAIRQTIRQTDADLPVPTFKTMDDVVSASVAQRRFQMTLVSLFAIVAMLLASLGVYGVLSYSVAQRTNEMGIRMALGARPSEIGTMILRQGLYPVWVGLGAGVILSFALGRLLGSLLFGVTETDPMTLVCVLAILSGVAVAACYLPAWRATRVEPIAALRYE